MRSLLTVDDFFSHILFLRTVDARTIMLVEGDTDCAALDPHIDSDSCDTLPTGSKTAALGTLRLAVQNGENNVIALVDSDFSRISQPSKEEPNVFYTSLYDLESELLAIASVRSRLLHSHAERESLRAALKGFREEPISIAQKASAAVASLRYTAVKEAWGFSVRDFPVHMIIDLDGKAPNILRMCRIALSKNQSTLDINVVTNAVQLTHDWMDKRFDLCSGHDTLLALSFVLNKRFGASTTSESLASALRAAIGCEDISTRQFFVDIFDWAEMNEKKVWSCGLPGRRRPAIPAMRTVSETDDMITSKKSDSA